MLIEKLIKAIELNLQKARKGQYLFDDDNIAEEIVKHFKSKGYKVRKISSYGTIYIAKRWWQK